MYFIYSKLYEEIEVILSNKDDVKRFMKHRESSHIVKKIKNNEIDNDFIKELRNDDRYNSVKFYGEVSWTENECLDMFNSCENYVYDVTHEISKFVSDVLPMIKMSDTERKLVDDAIHIMYNRLRSYSDGSDDDVFDLFDLFDEFEVAAKYYREIVVEAETYG